MCFIPAAPSVITYNSVNLFEMEEGVGNTEGNRGLYCVQHSLLLVYFSSQIIIIILMQHHCPGPAIEAMLEMGMRTGR